MRKHVSYFPTFNHCNQFLLFSSIDCKNVSERCIFIILYCIILYYIIFHSILFSVLKLLVPNTTACCAISMFPPVLLYSILFSFESVLLITFHSINHHTVLYRGCVLTHIISSLGRLECLWKGEVALSRLPMNHIIIIISRSILLDRCVEEKRTKLSCALLR